MTKRLGFTLAEGATHVGICDSCCKVAFTLAEVLITLGIIGVVAAMTIPTLIADYQDRSFNTAATVFERKLGEALKTMNTQQTLAGFSSTEDFVDELSKHFKISKTCANDKLTECFGEEVFWGSGTATPEAVDMSKVKTSKNFGQKDWQETNVVGVQFASGVSALIAYNKDAIQDPYSNQIVNVSGSSNEKNGYVNLGTDALAILYDTNGAKSPNQSSKDLRSINVSKLGGGCFAEVNGMCIAIKPQVPIPVSKKECEQLKADGYGINACSSYDRDYWAGAVKLCGGVSKMPTEDDLVKIANYIYNTSKVTKSGSTSKLTFDTSKGTELGLPSPSFTIWMDKSLMSSEAYYRFYGSTSTSSGYYSRSTGRDYLAICLGD